MKKLLLVTLAGLSIALVIYGLFAGGRIRVFGIPMSAGVFCCATRALLCKLQEEEQGEAPAPVAAEEDPER